MMVMSGHQHCSEYSSIFNLSDEYSSVTRNETIRLSITNMHSWSYYLTVVSFLSRCGISFEPIILPRSRPHWLARLHVQTNRRPRYVVTRPLLIRHCYVTVHVRVIPLYYRNYVIGWPHKPITDSKICLSRIIRIAYSRKKEKTS